MLSSAYFIYDTNGFINFLGLSAKLFDKENFL
jgi:hypothetical protein